MGRYSTAAPPASRHPEGIEPTVDATAYVHPFAQVAGAVSVGAQVSVAPGVSVRADQGSPCRLGPDASLWEGTMVQALVPGRVLGDDQEPYAVWVGARATLAHKAIVHGPVYVGDDCFVGFRSTIFNARLSPGCIVMMHALVQDVEIPAGKLVPSGAIITDQDQADALPDAQPTDWAIVKELVASHGNVQGSPAAPAAAPQCRPTYHHQDNGLKTMQPQRLTTDIVQQVRQLLSQGYRIGTEHADARRFRSNVWSTCTPVQSPRESEVLAALEACLEEHTGEYVRMFGIDPVAKRRVASVTIQRPDGKPVTVHKTAAAPVSNSSPSRYSAGGGASQVGGLSPEVVQQVRQLLSQGYRIGTEHADSRRFRSNVWQTCSPIKASHEGEVLNALQGCLRDHAGEYVRMFGIDPKAKTRVAAMTIQRPDGPVASNGSSAGSPGRASAAPSGGGYSGGGLPPEAVQQIRGMLGQGLRIGAEYADARRFRSNVWQTCPIEASHESGVLAAIAACMQAHPGEYVRVYGIDPKAKQRHTPVTVQRPGDRPSSSSSNSYAAPAPSVPLNNGHGSYQNGTAKGLEGNVVQQVQQLVNQGYRISLEHADARRFRSGVWQTAGPVEGHGASEVLSALERSLHAHSGEYVRLVGIDPQAKRRVLETTIQRP
jgi:carbon dioxide concentrating mechanism protein CcmM